MPFKQNGSWPRAHRRYPARFDRRSRSLVRLFVRPLAWRLINHAFFLGYVIPYYPMGHMAFRIGIGIFPQTVVQRYPGGLKHDDSHPLRQGTLTVRPAYIFHFISPTWLILAPSYCDNGRGMPCLSSSPQPRWHAFTHSLAPEKKNGLRQPRTSTYQIKSASFPSTQPRQDGLLPDFGCNSY